MKLNSLVQPSAERVLQGKVNEIEGLVSLAYNGVNFQGDKSIMIDCILSNGERHRVWCSKAVSKGLREKTITKKMIYGFPIGTGTRKDGSTFPQIQLPTSAVNNWVEFSVKDLVVEEFVPSVMSYEDLAV